MAQSAGHIGNNWDAKDSARSDGNYHAITKLGELPSVHTHNDTGLVRNAVSNCLSSIPSSDLTATNQHPFSIHFSLNSASLRHPLGVGKYAANNRQISDTRDAQSDKQTNTATICWDITVWSHRLYPDLQRATDGNEAEWIKMRLNK